MSRSWEVFRNINEQLRFADAKAAAILAFSGGSAAFLAGKTEVVHDIIVQNTWSVQGCVLYAGFMGYGILLVATIRYAFKSILPSLGKGDKRSLIFFKHIDEDYRGDYARYARDIAALSDEALERELAHQICTNSAITSQKFDNVNRAMACLAWTGAFWVLTVFLLFVLGSASVG